MTAPAASRMPAIAACNEISDQSPEYSDIISSVKGDR